MMMMMMIPYKAQGMEWRGLFIVKKIISMHSEHNRMPNQKPVPATDPYHVGNYLH